MLCICYCLRRYHDYIGHMLVRFLQTITQLHIDIWVNPHGVRMAFLINYFVIYIENLNYKKTCSQSSSIL